MTLFVQLRILQISVDEKMQICHTIPKLQRKKKSPNPAIVLFLGLFYSLEVVDLVTFQHNLV